MLKLNLKELRIDLSDLMHEKNPPSLHFWCHFHGTQCPITVMANVQYKEGHDAEIYFDNSRMRSCIEANHGVCGLCRNILSAEV